jgi:hypothetical protein
MTREPVAGLLLVVTASLIFARALAFRGRAASSFQAWARSLVQALAGALLFLGMAAAFGFLLNADYRSYSALHGSFTTGGSLANQDWLHGQSLYGGPLTQQDLVVNQYLSRETVEALPPADPAGRTLYRNTIVEEAITETSILGFDGHLNLDFASPDRPGDSYNAFTLEADYHYEIVNPTETATRLEFFFPLPTARLCRDIHLEMDGREIPWRAENGAMAWQGRLQPGERVEVVIHYLAQGMDAFIFESPVARLMPHFLLGMAVNADVSGLLSQPEGAVKTDISKEGRGTRVTWRIENSIAAPRLGMYPNQSWLYAPSHALIAALPFAARGLLLFLSMTAFTLLITGVPIDLRGLAQLAALFCLPFIFLMAGSLPSPWFILPRNWALLQVKMLPVFSLLPLGLAFLILRGVPRLPRALILLLMLLFLSAYPLAGLIPDEQKRNAVLGGVQVGMIFYTFALTLFVRIRLALRSQA